MGDTSPTPHRGASLPATGGTGAPTPTARASTRRSTGPSSARRELQPVESSISQASDHHASPDAAAPAAPDETASSEELTTENLSELILPAGTFNNIFVLPPAMKHRNRCHLPPIRTRPLHPPLPHQQPPESVQEPPPPQDPVGHVDLPPRQSHQP